MKKLLSIVLVLLLLFVGVGCNEQKETKVTELKTPAEKLGYALGTDIGKSFKTNEMIVDLQAFIQGFKDGTAGGDTLLSPDEIKVIQKEAIAGMRKRIEGKKKIASADNIKKDDEFMGANIKEVGKVPSR